MRKRRHSAHRFLLSEGLLSPVIRLWILRSLITLDGARKFINSRGFEDDRLASSLGLQIPDMFDDDDTHSASATLALLKSQLQAAEIANKDAKTDEGLPTEVVSNAHSLALRFGYGKVEQDILVFCVLLHTVIELRMATNYLGNLTTPYVISVLSTILGHDEEEVKSALSAQGRLLSSGLVSLSPQYADDLSARLDLLSDQFGQRMMSGVSDPMHLIRDTVAPGQLPTLTIDDYGHVERDAPMLHAYLKAALAQQRQGVNVFVYGPPGTGKSELARVMASELGCDHYEITAEDEDGDPIKGEQRLRALRVAHSFFANHRCLLVFDEAEDVFQDASPFGRSTAQNRKAWLNRTLENAAVPTIWLSNSHHGMDPAFIRRFDMVFCLGVPPENKRREILGKLAGDFLDDRGLKSVARSEELAPAVVTRSVSVLNAIREEVALAEHGASLLHLINNTLESQGLSRVETESATLPDYYDPAFINADADLPKIARQLGGPSGKQVSARFCMYGPPGTGKTAFGHWLAAELGKPLIIKRASDLLDKYVGGTEQKIAAAFRSAQSTGSLLMLDEVDSFLRDRRGADRSWEVTMVNELLTQIEAFQGILLVSTNLMEGLDQAALRRFDFKLRFDFLTPDQAIQLLGRLCLSLGLAQPEASTLASLGTLRALTPGDFAVVTRQQHFRPAASADELVDYLREEVTLKDNGQFMKKSIGFV